MGRRDRRSCGASQVGICHAHGPRPERTRTDDHSDLGRTAPRITQLLGMLSRPCSEDNSMTNHHHDRPRDFRVHFPALEFWTYIMRQQWEIEFLDRTMTLRL